jgi:hypothetical protein
MPQQNRLFPDDSTPALVTSAPGVGLTQNALKFGAGPMSPAQKRYSQLLAQTETLTKEKLAP